MFASQIVDFGATVSPKANEKSSSGNLKNPLKGMNFNFGKFPNLFETVKKHKYISAFAVLTLVVLVALAFGLSNPNSSIPLVSGVNQTNFSPAKQTTLNRKFEIPIRKQTGETTGNNLVFSLTTVDQSNRILIQGKPATARATKTFIILNMEVQNSTNDQLTVKPVDLIRLIATDGKSFAPDVHNNDVIVEPISIKRTRVGFVVDENQTNFKFTVGEINGQKETIEVSI